MEVVHLALNPSKFEKNLKLHRNTEIKRLGDFSPDVTRIGLMFSNISAVIKITCVES